MGTYDKDPNAVLDYGFEWDDWLAAGETLVSSDWIIPEGLDKADSSDEDSNIPEGGEEFTATGSTTVWLKNGEDGENYKITNRVHTSQGRTDDRSHRIQVRQK